MRDTEGLSHPCDLATAAQLSTRTELSPKNTGSIMRELRPNLQM